MPVATMTRRVWMRPPAVNTSAVLRLNVTFVTGDALEQQRAALGRGDGEAEARAIRIERRAVLARAAPAAASSADLAGDRARVEQRRVEAGGAPRLLLALEARGLVRRHRDGHRRMRLDEALHVEPAQQRGEVERRAPPALERALARRARRSPARDRRTRRPGSSLIQPDADAAAAAPDLLRLEQHHLRRRPRRTRTPWRSRSARRR